MNFRPQKAEEPEINLTPLIDVVFLMLIFFMVSTTFEKESAVKVELPRASTAEQIEENQLIEITINAKGDFFINRIAVVNRTAKTLKAAIIKLVGEDRDKPYIIRADANAPHQSVVTALDVAGQLGFDKVSIPTVLNEDDNDNEK